MSWCDCENSFCTLSITNWLISFAKESLSESENGQRKLNIVVFKGELLSTILPQEKAKVIQAKVVTAKEDWKNFLSTLHQKESALEVWSQSNRKWIE